MTTTAKELFDDLLTLEVNTVVKDGMTARKMPDLPQALIDIFDAYDIWLCQLAGKLNPRWRAFAQSEGPAFLDAHPAGTLLIVDNALITSLQQRRWTDKEHPRWAPTGGQESRASHDDLLRTADFDEMRTEARRAEEMSVLMGGDAHTDAGDLIILKRIYRNCDQIKGILEGRELESSTSPGKIKAAATKGFSRSTSETGDLPLRADEVLIVRKAWEVGTETVVMQTVAQIDGDVITRIQNARASAADKPLQDLHREAVGTALQHWQFLVETFVQITTKAAGFLAR